MLLKKGKCKPLIKYNINHVECKTPNFSGKWKLDSSGICWQSRGYVIPLQIIESLSLIIYYVCCQKKITKFYSNIITLHSNLNCKSVF